MSKWIRLNDFLISVFVSKAFPFPLFHFKNNQKKNTKNLFQWLILLDLFP